MPGVLGSSGRLFPHFGLNFEPLPYADHPTRDANDDWLFGAPVPTAINDPYAGDEGGRLITEHPNNIGTPKPAMFTPYSLGALVFATSFIWLSADLRARDGSGLSHDVGMGVDRRCFNRQHRLVLSGLEAVQIDPIDSRFAHFTHSQRCGWPS